MSTTPIADRYEQFQKDAVGRILKDFQKNPCGRFLLVVPTAGGKTFVAVKSINRLFDEGVIDAATDRVLWTAHREELLEQAKKTFAKFEEAYPEAKCHAGSVDFLMLSKVDDYLANKPVCKLAVIDEAHHGAAPSYRTIFGRPELGILGLTATPTRHDGAPLEFERESYSIGFPDLVKKGIVIKPEIRRVTGGIFEISDFDETSLEALNNLERNQKIISELQEHPDDYKKVIVYVGTKTHVKSLYQQLQTSPLKDHYESIAWITGEGNSRDLGRKAFLDQERGFARSILVNVSVLSEGYDDPKINTVVMATPCKSKLYYMQAMGRAIRCDPGDPVKKAYCIEVVDELPNIRYRIDNRWLYSDVSDALEPAVEDREYSSAEQLNAQIKAVYDTFTVPPEHRSLPAFDNDQRYSMLLFNRYLKPDTYAHYPILITNDNRTRVANMFNFLSERMRDFKQKGVVPEVAFRMIGADASALLPEEQQRRWVYHAMEAAVPGTDPTTQPGFEKAGAPWITFLAFHYREQEISPVILAFICEMVNKDAILEQLTSRSFEKDARLLRLPLPLKSYIGKIVTAAEFLAIDCIVQALRHMRLAKSHLDHRADVHNLLAESVLPIELAHKDSLSLIARDDTPYYLELD